MLTAFPPLLDRSGNRLSRVEEGLDFWREFMSSFDKREDSLLMSSICRAIAMSMLRYVRLMVSKVGALETTVRSIHAGPGGSAHLKPTFPDFSLSNFFLAACRWLSNFSTLSRMLCRTLDGVIRYCTYARTRTCFLNLACFSRCSGPRLRVFSILAKSGLFTALLNLTISSFLVDATQTVGDSFFLREGRRLCTFQHIPFDLSQRLMEWSPRLL